MFPLQQCVRLAWPTTLAIMLAMSLALAGGFAQAQDAKPQPKARPKPAAKPADPKAQAILNEVAKAYKSLGSYSDEGKFVVAMTLAGKPQNQTVPLKLTFVRPNKLDLDAGPVRLTSDGKTLTTAVIPLKRYTTAPSPAQIGLETFREGPTGAILFGGPAGPPMFVLLNLLTSPDATATLAQLGGSLQLAPDAPSAGKPASPALLIDQPEGADFRLEIDPATKLLARIDLQVDPKDLARSAQAGQPVTISEFGWSSGSVSTEVAEDRSFAYVPPEGFNKVDSLTPRANEEPKFAVDQKVGKPAPDFTLTVLDGPDKTRTVTKAELAGKVVVIDFWATWCGPCLMELPEVQKVIEALAKEKKDVVVVALSQDAEPKELVEVRKLVEKTLEEKKLYLDTKPVGMIALDPSNSIGQAFEVEGFPTLVVLDAKGTVQSAHVGNDPNIRQKLTSEIETLLAGKSLAKGAAKPKEAVK
jgi:thiol-disulfide isomerase/thioredoxin